MASSSFVKEKARAALLAMKRLGISEKKVKPVLKNLLRVYEKNWDLIEAENYRVLADAIFEEEDKVAAEGKKCDFDEDNGMHHEPEQSLRSPITIRSSALMMDKREICSSAEASKEETGLQDKPCPSKRPRLILQKGPGLVSPHPSEYLARPTGISLKEPKLEEDEDEVPRTHSRSHPQDNLESAETLSASSQVHAGDKGKQPLVSSDSLSIQERADRLALVEVASDSLPSQERADRLALVASPVKSSGATSSKEPLKENVLHSPKEVPEGPVLAIKDEPFTFDTVQCETVVTAVHPVACIIPPELGTDSTCQSSQPESIDVGQSEEKSVTLLPSPDPFKKSNAFDALSADVNKGNPCLPSDACVSNGSDNSQCLEDPDKSNSCSLVVVPQSELSADGIRTLISINDITKGQEKLEISWINEVNGECPPPFYYIAENHIFKNACVNLSLSQIGDDKCCSTCFGDCLASAITCNCAHETGGCYAYAVDGLLREHFLEECVSLTRNPKKACISYCEECPIMRNNDDTEHCKGHLARKFIKECWRRCGCSRHCSNRVVQRGITCKLQVFYTTDGKGWGVRALEDLPKGAFVCEYVGEILTCSELSLRKMHSANSMRDSFPVLLDAAWTSGILKNEEALCLDATSYGNVARFINHRCLDANLVEIPVEVETPDHHYYRLAFFTTRKVDALEELTWDYGIDFEDQGHPSEIFQCNCGSKFCRNMRRSTRKHITLINAH